MEFIPFLDLSEHGHWIYSGMIRCSICDRQLQTADIPRYCPNCGAIMDEMPCTIIVHNTTTKGATQCLNPIISE